MSVVPVPSSESESIAVASANSVAAASCRESRAIEIRGNILPEGGWFGRMCHALWKPAPGKRSKVPAHLHCLIGGSERTSRAYAAGDAEPGAGVLVQLLRSDQGARVLDFIMDGSAAAWWRELRRARIVAAAFDAAHARIEQQLELQLE